MARNSWAAFDGWAASRNVDPERLPLHRYLNLIYHWATKNAERQEDLDKFDRQLWLPPAGSAEPIPDESPWSAANETAAFDAFNQQFSAM